jgi:hypothetical protein
MYLDSIPERMFAIGRVGESSDAVASLEQSFGDVAAGIAEGARYYVQLAIISHRGPVLPPTVQNQGRASTHSAKLDDAAGRVPCIAMFGRHASRDSVFFVLLQRIAKITVTGALHDCLHYGESHVGAKTFCTEKIRIPAACQQES